MSPMWQGRALLLGLIPVSLLAVLGALEPLERATLHARFRWRDSAMPSPPVTVAVVRGERLADGASLREALADALDALVALPARERPRVVLVDAVLSLDPQEGPVEGSPTGRILEATRTLGNVVHAIHVSLQEAEFRDPPGDLSGLEPHLLAAHWPGGLPFVFGLRLPHPGTRTTLLAGAEAIGFTNLSPRNAAGLSHIPLAARLELGDEASADVRVVPALVLAGLKAALCPQRALQDCILPTASGIQAPEGRLIPVDDTGEFHVNYRHRFRFPFLSEAVGAMEGLPPPDRRPEVVLFRQGPDGPKWLLPDGSPALSVLLTSEIVAARDDFCGSSTRASGARGPSDREEGESACRGRRGGGSASPASFAGAARAEGGFAGQCLLIVDGREPQTASTPLGAEYPQQTVHAQALANLLEQDFLWTPPAGSGTGVGLGLCLLAIWRRARFRRHDGGGTELRQSSSQDTQPAWLESLSRLRRVGVGLEAAMPELWIGAAWCGTSVLAFEKSVVLPMATPTLLLLGQVLGQRLLFTWVLKRELAKRGDERSAYETLLRDLEQRTRELDALRCALEDVQTRESSSEPDSGGPNAARSRVSAESALEEQPPGRDGNSTRDLPAKLAGGADPPPGRPAPAASSAARSGAGHPPGEVAREVLLAELEHSDKVLGRAVELMSDAMAPTVGVARPSLAPPARAHADALLEQLKQAGGEVEALLEQVTRARDRLKERPGEPFLEHYLTRRRLLQQKLIDRLVRAEEESGASLRQLEQLRALAAGRSTGQEADLELERRTGCLTRDPEMRRLLSELVERIAPSRLPVLVLGESGTGKELIASALHRNSPRSGRPLIAYNCAVASSSLLESELFGHVKGAYTGALGERRGLFREADGGTLFLDELGEMPMEVQARLLRVLQEGAVQPVGGDFQRALRVDVRLIAATNVNLEQRVQDGTFRADLFFRLRGVVLRIPPLRERTGDIELLAEHFLAQERGRLRRRLQLAVGAVEALLSHPWPGNVRELRSTIESLAVLSEGDVITAEAVWRQLAGTARNLVVSGAALFSAEDRELLARQRQHGFNATLCGRDERYPGGRTAADRHLRGFLCRALWLAGWDLSSAARLLAEGDSALEARLERRLRAFLSNLQERMRQHSPEALEALLRRELRTDVGGMLRVVDAVRDGRLPVPEEGGPGLSQHDTEGGET